jgi:hypothetical protein
MVLIVGDPRAEWVDGLRRALSGALDPRVRVEVSALSGPHELQSSLDRLGGDATLNLAAVEFPQSPSHARVRLRAAHAPQFVTRELSFSITDEPGERGRAIGFLISSMVPELRAGAAFPPPAPPPPRPKAVATAKSAPAAAPDEHAVVTPAVPTEPPPPAVADIKPAPPEEPPPPAPPPPAPAGEPPPTQTKIIEPPPSEPERKRRVSIELAGLGTWGADRSTPDGGGTLAGQLFFGRVFIRLGVAVTGGMLSEASATTTSFGPAAGVGYLILDDRFQLGVRLDLAAVYFAVSRSGETRDRWELGLKPRLDAAFTISGPFAVFGAFGADIGMSSTKVKVGEQVTDLPPVAAALEAGFRVSF